MKKWVELVDYLDLGEQCNIKQFVKKLEIGDHAPDFNPFFDARDRELVSLKRAIAAPWQWEATDELFAKSKELQGYSTSPIKKAGADGVAHLRAEEKDFGS